MQHNRTSPAWICLIVVALNVASTGAVAEERLIQGVIKAIDNPQATLTITVEVNGKPRDETFKVEMQAKVTLSGQQTSLKNLAAGQWVTVECESPANIATQVDAFKPVNGEPKFETLNELSKTQPSRACPYLMPDGLTLYWSEFDQGLSSPMISVATRKTPQGNFSDTKELVRGFDPTLTADGLRLILVNEGLFECVREVENASFEAPRKFEELSRYGRLSGPSLSFDGLTLYATQVDFKESPAAHKFLVFHRKSRDAKWDTGQPVTFSDVDQARLRSTMITPDGKYAFAQLWLSGKSFPLLVFRARRNGQGYESPRLLRIGKTIPLDFSPRSYHAATNELIGTKTIWEGSNFDFKVVVLRNFDLHALTAPPAEYLGKLD